MSAVYDASSLFDPYLVEDYMNVASITRDAKGRRTSMFYPESTLQEMSLDPVERAADRIPAFEVPTADAYTASQHAHFHDCHCRGEVIIHPGVGTEHGGVIEDCRTVRSECVPFDLPLRYILCESF